MENWENTFKLSSSVMLLLLLLSHFSRVRLCATPWTAAYQASPSMGFSRQAHWSGLPCPPQGIFLTQGSNLCLLHYRQSLYHWVTGEAPKLYNSLLNTILKQYFTSPLTEVEIIYSSWLPESQSRGLTKGGCSCSQHLMLCMNFPSISSKGCHIPFYNLFRGKINR